MSDRPSNFEGEPGQTKKLAPENTNTEQRDQPEQAQTVAGQALNRSTSVLGLDDSEKVNSAFNESSAQDVVEKMEQMESSGTIDNSAYRGEPNHDDNVDKYGKARVPEESRDDPA